VTASELSTEEARLQLAVEQGKVELVADLARWYEEQAKKGGSR